MTAQDAMTPTSGKKSTPPPDRPARTRRLFGPNLLSTYSLVGVLVVLFVGFSLARPESFGTVDNFRAVLNNQVTVVFLAMAVTLPLVVGEFDLSVASTFGLSQMLTVGLVLQHGVPVVAAIAAALAMSAVVGLANGIAITRFGINSFIATLAAGSILTGVTLAYSKGESVYGAAPAALTDISRGELLGLKLPVVYAAVTVLALAVVMYRMPLGRRMYAIGSNKRAAELSGVPAGSYIVLTFVSSSVLAGVGGVVLGASIGAATPDTGNSLLIPAFAGAFLGATAITPGRFNIMGTLVAVYVVGVAVAGLQQVGVALWVEPVFNGAMLFVAVGLSSWTARQRKRRAERARIRELESRREESLA
ncbi:ABC transporter permease [Streptomyces sp. NPDC101175]|uniref:ABC transporter permease n=1 Tax=Streptomyces sp. NPDC101175 TaxID=3366123 RepID=UPI003835BEBA